MQCLHIGPLLAGGGLLIGTLGGWCLVTTGLARPGDKKMEERLALRGPSWADIRDFGGAAGGPDTTPAFNRAVAWCWKNHVYHLYFPAGNYLFKSAPRPIDFGICLKGDGISATVLEKDFDNGNFLTFTGASDNYGGGMQDLSLLARPRRSPGNAIMLEASARHAPHYMEFKNLWISGAADPKGGKAGVWGNVFMIDGRRAVGPIQGVRGVRLQNCHFFNADGATLYAFNAVGLTVNGGGFYQGDGKNCRIMITGGGTLGKDNSDGVIISTNLNGELNLTNCQKVIFDGTMGEFNAGDTGWYCRITGICSGRHNNGLRSSYVHLVP